MEKVKFESFISKYNLNGTCESVLLNVSDGKVNTRASAGDNNVMCDVQFDGDLGFENGSYAVYNTAKLRSLLGVVGDTLTVSNVEEDGEVMALNFDDGSTDVTFALAEASVIPKVPELKKLPPFDLSILVNDDFIKTYVKAKGALDVSTFAVVSNGKKSEATIVLGHGTRNTNKVKIKVDTEKAVEMDAIEFSAPYLREILVANKDAEKGKMEISSKGLARLTFQTDDIKSTYYLVQVDTEE
jgi:DNA polymerase III sliding clamp (beta) subunit (PCNA family)